ncbi:MAG: carotenoid biosynthesis protein [Sphingomonadales bacterium]|nr:carotenoid biosynthesis protein [Sphingomonadales bacterium]
MQGAEKRVVGIAAIIYAIGLTGLFIAGTRAQVIGLTPLNLGLSLSLPLIFQKKWSFGLFTGLLCVAVCGFFIEYAGVHTGLLFGNYHYGKTLGIGWQGIPYMIGINWAMLVFFVVSSLSGRIGNAWGIAITGGFIMTFYDFIMEPGAVWMGMWHWKNGIIPMQNYIAWFICSFLLIRLYLWVAKPERNAIATALLIIQTVFFAAVRLIV